MADHSTGIRITAKDDASKTIDALAKKVDKLDGESVELTVEAKVDKALKAFDDVAAEAKAATEAAQALGQALGAELSAGVDLHRMVHEFENMGLTLEEVKLNANQLGTKLREVGASGGIAQIGQRTRAVSADTDRLSDSARGAHSALANMVGNASQDIGSITGVAGSAGVALGQMAEFAADAALAGEGLGSALGSMVKVAAPIAGLALVVQGISSVLSAYRDQAERAAEVKSFNADNAKEFVDWATKGLDVVNQLVATTRDKGVVQIAPDAKEQTEALKILALDGENLYDTIQRINDQGGPDFDMHTADEGLESINKLLLKSGILLKDTTNLSEAFFTAARDPRAFDSYVGKIKSSNLSLADQARLLGALIFQRDQFNAGQRDAADATALFGTQTDDANKKLEEQKKALEESHRAFKETADALTKWAADTEQAFIRFGVASADLTGFSSLFNNMARASTAMQTAFNLGNAPIEFLDDVTSIHDGMRDLVDFVSKNKVGNIFDPNNVNAGPFLQKIQGLRAPIQAKVADAFSTGGAAGAKTTAAQYVNELFHALGGRISKGDIAALLGLDNIDATIRVAVEQNSLAEAQKLIDTLVGVGGETPYTAEIKLALAAGDITPETAKVLAARALGQLGVDVPSKLGEPKTAEAKAAADRFAAENEIKLGSAVDAPTNAKTIHDNAQTSMAGLGPVMIPTVFASPKEFERRDGGGTVGGAGGIAGERRPEIIDGRYLVTGPTYVPPGTRVTSGARTARILRTRGTRGLRSFDGGGTVPAGPSNLTVNFNGVGSIGNRYDLMRVMRKAQHDGKRLYGNRG